MLYIIIAIDNMEDGKLLGKKPTFWMVHLLGFIGQIGSLTPFLFLFFLS